MRGEVPPFVLAGGPNDPLNYAQVEYSHDGDTYIAAMGPSAATLTPCDLGGIRDQMKRFRPDLDVLAVSGHDWVADPYSAQTWPMLKTNQLAVLASLQDSVDDVILPGPITQLLGKTSLTGQSRVPIVYPTKYLVDENRAAPNGSLRLAMTLR